MRSASKEELDTEMRKVWRLWQKIRVALSTPTSRRWQYDDIFDEYHFTHSPEVLARIIADEGHGGPSECDRDASDLAAATTRYANGNL